MAAKTSEWRPGPTVCRCCLSEGCYKDISTEYFWMGKREVYSEMLSDTFDLSISYSKSGGPNSASRLICEPCIGRLRDAAEFKRQVQECEKTFVQCLDPVTALADMQVTLELEKEVKVEMVKEEKMRLSDDDDYGAHDYGDDDDDYDDLDDQPLTKLASKIPKKEDVDVLDLLDNAKVTEKRKSSTKVKGQPSKKSKCKQTAGSSKQQKPEPKKKKGERAQTENESSIKIETTQNLHLDDTLKIEKRRYQRSARAEARFITKKNASALLECWSVTPFRWKRNRFKCAYCEDNFTDCAELRAHVMPCSMQHNTKDIYSKFKEMTLINVDITGASCKTCTLPCRGVSDMRQHAIDHGYDIDTSHPDGVLPFCLDKESWRCVICQETFNNFLKLYEHMNVHYQHYICATCGKGYMTAPRLRKHSEVHITGTFPCDKCKRVFTMRAARDYHKSHAHAKGPRYECPQCNMRFGGYYERMNHLNEAHREKEVAYKCAHCELSFKTSGKRATHVKSVHFPQQRNFACPFCKWFFKTGYELKRHIVRHTGERNFCCTLCGKTFPRNRALRKHFKTHEDLNCKWCGVMFNQKPLLMEHFRTNHPEISDFVISGLEKI
ncbi:oocyte zinc finger protein XlCOF22 isoform X5 [Bicyclus anynana]|uniref:Oocyte zinc finger protein XlCOF22 isoform X5 n=1 Tax=Bicyclus anynana TaxID=110368 RepID=A0A6J1N499_BICAN|nr:oocyte zinc finger protein XlCOF22 isoform X5 [Bicyclus anynana]